MMDQRKRTTRRISFTKALRLMNNLMDREQSSNLEIKSAFEGLVRRYQELEEVSAKILEKMFTSEDIDDEDLEKTSEENHRYESEFLTAKCRFEEVMASREEKAQSSRSSENSASRVRYNLPKVELVKFSGNLREWMTFWSLFRKIHEDAGLRDEDKFQYLIQSMVPGSRAADLVSSYPPIGKNYNKAIESLTKRFGREDLQIEVYVRELLQLVLENALSKKKVLLATLYDKIESYIRALETLGVTTDKCAAMLYPLVESSLPEELLRVWQRSDNSVNVGKASELSKTRLDALIRFLESEVQNELRISMAVKGFNIRGNDEKPEIEKRAVKNTPSARSLLVAMKSDSCIFCGKRNHASDRCFKAEKMSSSEKRDIVRTNRVCFGCLKSGHLKKQSKAEVKCTKCGKGHVDLMCLEKRGRVKSRDSISEHTVSAVNIPKECALASSAEIPGTFMQTLRVRVRNDFNDVVVRALIDTGSQNSYVLGELAEKMDYKPVGQQDMVHLLFGGSQSNVATHQKFEVRVGNLDGTYWCNFEALDEKIICPDVPCVKKGPWLKDLHE